MKPKTKLQFRVAELAKYLFQISNQQKEWAYKECLEHRGFATKNRVLCLDCGDTFSPQLVSRKKAVCPHCDTKLTISNTRKTTDNQTNYFAICEIEEEFQVVRNFEIIAKYKKGKPADYFIHEILQYWIQPDEKVTMFGLQHHLNSYCDNWSGNMEIRTESTRGWHGYKYDIYARKYHPDSKFKKEYAQLGIDCNLSDFTVIEAIKHLPNYRRLETLCKARYYNFLNMDYRHRIDMHWNSLKIVFRNKYKISDSSLYLDYLDLLRFFNKDLRNSKFVCPKNLKKEHDYWMNKKTEVLKKQELEKEEKISLEYRNRIKKFLNLEFTHENISIKILESIEEFREEAKELKHCVYTNAYYNKENSLIFSAKVDGKRTETIEVVLPTLKIAQSRGLKNNATKYHKQIVDLISKNLTKIKKAEYSKLNSRKVKLVS